MKNYFYVCALTAFSLLSCEKGTDIKPNSLPKETSLEAGEIFAKNLALSLKDEEMVSFITKTAGEQFDGDNNFLISPNLDREPITKSECNRTFRELLKDSQFKTKAAEQIDLDALLKKLEMESPLQQIYVMNEEIWDTTTQLPIVVYLPEDFDEKNTLWVTGYDIHGKAYQLDARGEFENQPIVVVSQNERTVSVSKEKVAADGIYHGAKPIYENSYFYYYLLEDIEYPIQTNYIETPLMPTSEMPQTRATDCYRASHTAQKDYINRVTITSLSAWRSIEAALKGDPELYVNVVYGEKTNGKRNITSMRKYIGTGYGRRRNIKWATKDIDILRWSRSDNGENMKYMWFEKDGRDDNGITVDFSVEFLGYPTVTGSAEIHVWKNDDNAGESVIYYQDENDTYYNTGIVKYNIQIK